MKNKIFTEDIFYEPEITKAVRKRDKQYQKTDWNKIEEKACLAVCVGAVGLVIVHTVLFLIK